MNYPRENEPRSGRSEEANGGNRSRNLPMNGFEGMNYEQRREPYKNGRRNWTQDRNGNNDASNAPEQEYRS